VGLFAPRFALVLALASACTFGSLGPGAGEGGMLDGATTGTADTTAAGPSATAAATDTSGADAGASGSDPPTSDGAQPSTGDASGTTGEPTTTDPSESSGTGEALDPEICDGLDNDGDGGIDEGSPLNPSCGTCTFVLAVARDRWFAICSDPMPWSDARTACAGFGPGADLVRIDDPIDQGVLIGLAPGDHHIGLTDEQEEGHWRWVDGTDAIVDGNVVGYDGWAGSQPEGGPENCGELDSAQSGWADTSCDGPQPRICEHPA
jgi:hypothetical protein